MAKATKARTKRGTKDQPVDAEIRRRIVGSLTGSEIADAMNADMRRRGVDVPLPTTQPAEGRTLGEILAEKHPEMARKAPELPITEELRRAAERIGIPAEALARQRLQDAARDEIIASLGPKLVLACDQLSEELADIVAAGPGGENHNVLEALHTIWQVRWELGLYAKSSAREEQAEQSARGAS